MAGFHGKFVWHEAMTSDPPAAESFYRSIVGWQAKDAGMEGVSYTILSADGAPVET